MAAGPFPPMNVGVWAHRERGKKHLFWHPETLAWVVVDALGARVIEALRSGCPLEETRALLIHEGLNEEEAESELQRFWESLREVGFLGPPARGPCFREQEPSPHVLYLHLTERCNRSCTYCYFGPKARPGRDLPLLLAQQVLEEARALGITHVVLTGGEPLLHPQALSILACAKQCGFFVELLTNGAGLTREIAQELQKVCDRVVVSLDSIDPAPHDKHRGRGSHAQAIRAIQTLKEAGVREVAAAAVITRDNQDEPAAAFQAFAKGLGADRVARQVYIAQGNEQDARLAPDFPRLLAQLEADLEKDVEKGTLPTEGKLVWRDGCGAGSGVIAVGADGMVYPCQGLIRSEFAAGSLRQKALAHIYRDAPLLKHLRSLRVQALEPCRTCAFRHLCGGGCRALAFNLTGSLEAPLPSDYCVLRQLLAERTLWSQALRNLIDPERAAQGISSPPC